jgi:hypothetical protein
MTMTNIILNSSLVENKRACGKENFRNIQIINISKLLQNDNTTVYINDIMKEPSKITCNINITTSRETIEFLAKNIASNYTSAEYLQLLIEHESNIDFIEKYIIAPTHSIILTFLHAEQHSPYFCKTANGQTPEDLFNLPLLN